MTDYRNQYGIPYNPRFPWYWVLGVGVAGVVAISFLRQHGRTLQIR